MSINRKIVIVAALAGMMFGVSSCKKFLNVNTNPNGVLTPTLATLLPGAQLYVGTGLGVDLEIDGSFYAQFWTQSPGATQYLNLIKYTPGQDQFSYAWTNLYSAAENFYQLGKLADSQKNKPYKAIALLMEAYTFQLITDAWGNVPYSQALKGQYADGHLVNPKYDLQDSIYSGIISMIDTANALLALNGPSGPGSDDLVYGGVMTEWQKFSNTLALRVYMRMSMVNPTVAATGIAGLYANATTSTFIGTGDDAFIGYGYNSANANPLYSEEIGLGSAENLIANGTCFDTMVNDNDPRYTIFYEPITGTGPGTGVASVYVGQPNGLYFNQPYSGYSYPSGYVAGDPQNTLSAKAPVNLLTSYESYFLQAEAVARGFTPLAAGMDDTFFYDGIAASFTYYNNALTTVTGSTGAANYAAYIAAGTYWTLYPETGTTAQKLQYIITQKWFAMCGNQGFEAWSEWRRTGYPNWFTYSASTSAGDIYPKRFYYPTSESTVNANYPGLVSLTTPVWWDVQNALQGTADH